MAANDGTIRVSNITQDRAMVRNNVGGVKLSFRDKKHQGNMGRIICSPKDIVNTPRNTMGDITRGNTKDFIIDADRVYKVYFDAGRDPMGRSASEVEYITGKDIAKVVLSEEELAKQGYDKNAVAVESKEVKKALPKKEPEKNREKAMHNYLSRLKMAQNYFDVTFEGDDAGHKANESAFDLEF